MFSYGYCYGGVEGKSGFRPGGTVSTKKEAQDAIKANLAGKKVTFSLSGGKYRAYADEHPTGYIFFPIRAEQWVAFDKSDLGAKGERAKIAVGTLEEVKIKARKYVERSYEEYGNAKVERVDFDRAGDNITVTAKIKKLGFALNPDMIDKDVVLLRVS